MEKSNTSRKFVVQEKTIMLKLTELLLQENLISPEEKLQLSKMIRAEDER